MMIFDELVEHIAITTRAGNWNLQIADHIFTVY